MAKKLNRILAAKFQEDHAKLIRQVVVERGEDISSFLRRGALLELARLSYLSPSEKKSLGVDNP